MKVKYPRTLHHPASPGVQSDDKRAQDLTALEGLDVVITEKMDGENTSLYQTGFHARSLDSGYHASRDWLSAFHATLSYRIPEGWRLCGEYLYAKHAIAYTHLPSYFLAFSLWDDQNTCQSWDKTRDFCASLDVKTVPELYRGPWQDGLAETVAEDLDTSRQEGFVIRPAGQFSFDDFSALVLKWVRPGHVQTETHWRSAPIVPNGLGAGS